MFENYIWGHILEHLISSWALGIKMYRNTMVLTARKKTEKTVTILEITFQSRQKSGDMLFSPGGCTQH